MSPTSHLLIGLIGTGDFQRRLQATLASTKRSTPLPPYDEIKTVGVNPAEARTFIFTERPCAVVLEVGVHTTRQEVRWLHSLLADIRNRFAKKIYIIASVTTPEKLALASSLLFSEDHSLSPSGYLDNLIIAPPLSVPGTYTLEEQFLDCLKHVYEQLSQAVDGQYPLPALWEDGWVPAMCDPESRNIWMRWLPRYARYVNESPIIIGPTGSGKTRLAAALHELSGRTGPFVSITPRDFSSSELIQAELFGAVAGAFTGAVDKWGLVKRAEQGTLFIDELQSIDRDLQGKLITFIENKVYRRVGEADSNEANVRFVFATNRTLEELVRTESLRDDFAYRLERLQITLPPLYDRRLDIAAGSCFALGKVLRERAQALTGSGEDPRDLLVNRLEGLTPDAYRLLFSASWPGNLRQLENTIAKLVELADMKEQMLIDGESTVQILNTLLGQKEMEGADIVEIVARAIALEARAHGVDSLSECLSEFSSRVRALALEVSGGDFQKAASLIDDSPKAMELFAEASMTEPRSQTR